MIHGNVPQCSMYGARCIISYSCSDISERARPLAALVRCRLHSTVAVSVCRRQSATSRNGIIPRSATGARYTDTMGGDTISRASSLQPLIERFAPSMAMHQIVRWRLSLTPELWPYVPGARGNKSISTLFRRKEVRLKWANCASVRNGAHRMATATCKSLLGSFIGAERCETDFSWQGITRNISSWQMTEANGKGVLPPGHTLAQTWLHSEGDERFIG